MRPWSGFVGWLGWLLCAARLHVPAEHDNVAMRISWVCVRCGEQVPGGLAERRKRRRW
jgi:hypothetical protein